LYGPKEDAGWNEFSNDQSSAGVGLSGDDYSVGNYTAPAKETTTNTNTASTDPASTNTASTDPAASTDSA